MQNPFLCHFLLLTLAQAQLTFEILLYLVSCQCFLNIQEDRTVLLCMTYLRNIHVVRFYGSFLRKQFIPLQPFGCGKAPRHPSRHPTVVPERCGNPAVTTATPSLRIFAVHINDIAQL